MIHHNVCWQCHYDLRRELGMCFIADELIISWSFVWDQFVILGSSLLGELWKWWCLKKFGVPMVAFQRHALYFELWRFPWETSKWETRRVAVVEKKSCGWLFPGNVLITWNSVRKSVKNRRSRMFISLQTDVWTLTFSLHSVVDCVPNSASLYKGPLTASQTGGLGSFLHFLLL